MAPAGDKAPILGMLPGESDGQRVLGEVRWTRRLDSGEAELRENPAGVF